LLGSLLIPRLFAFFNDVRGLLCGQVKHVLCREWATQRFFAWVKIITKMGSFNTKTNQPVVGLVHPLLSAIMSGNTSIYRSIFFVAWNWWIPTRGFSTNSRWFSHRKVGFPLKNLVVIFAGRLSCNFPIATANLWLLNTFQTVSMTWIHFTGLCIGVYCTGRLQDLQASTPSEIHGWPHGLGKSWAEVSWPLSTSRWGIRKELLWSAYTKSTKSMVVSCELSTKSIHWIYIYFHDTQRVNLHPRDSWGICWSGMFVPILGSPLPEIYMVAVFSSWWLLDNACHITSIICIYPSWPQH
jgi:hypothetical protein